MTANWTCPRCGRQTYEFLHSCRLKNLPEESLDTPLPLDFTPEDN